MTKKCEESSLSKGIPRFHRFQTLLCYQSMEKNFYQMAVNFLIFFLDRCLHKIKDFDVYFWLFPHSLCFLFFSYFFIYSPQAIHPNVFSKVSVTNHVLNDMYHFSLEDLGKIFFWCLVWFGLGFFVS